jgi:hypothetical protein
MTRKAPNEFMIYVSTGEGGLRRVSGPVKAEDLPLRLETVRNCFGDSPVHVTGIEEHPHMSYLPKCTETGNCAVVTPEDLARMQQCLGG